MKWVDGECQITSDLNAIIWNFGKQWDAHINSPEGSVWIARGFDTEATAKSAVAAWIGKTIAQLGNALAVGEPRVDEE